MTEERLENICLMETVLNKTQHFLSQADSLLEQWREILVEVKKLDDYYGSEQWREDNEESNRGHIPQGMPHGVLSEDSVYNVLSHQYFLAIDYIKLMTSILDRSYDIGSASGKKIDF